MTDRLTYPTACWELVEGTILSRLSNVSRRAVERRKGEFAGDGSGVFEG